MNSPPALLRLEKLPPARPISVGVGDREYPLHIPYEPAWLFLDYGPGYELHRFRWAIGARGEDGLWLFSPWMTADTAEDSLDRIPQEVELAREAIRQIRSRS